MGLPRGSASSRANGNNRKLKLQGEVEAREKASREVLKEIPDHSESLYGLTDTLLKKGDIDELRSFWEKAYPQFFNSNSYLVLSLQYIYIYLLNIYSS